MANGTATINGVHREIVQIVATNNGIYREVTDIPVTLNGVYHEGYVAQKPIRITFARGGYSIEKPDDFTYIMSFNDWQNEANMTKFTDVGIGFSFPASMLTQNWLVTQKVVNSAVVELNPIVGYWTIRDNNVYSSDPATSEYLIGIGSGGENFTTQFERTDTAHGYASPNYGISYNIRVQKLWLISGEVTIETTFKAIN